MADTITTSELLDKLDAARARWDALIAAVPEQRMEETGAAGAWSVKDVLAHVAVYERWTADQLAAMLRGETTMYIAPDVPPGANTNDTDARNAAYYEAWRHRSLAEVRDEAQASFALLRSTIEHTPEDLLNATGRFEWLGPWPVWQMIPGNSYEHYDDHLPSLRAWLEKRDR